MIFVYITNNCNRVCPYCYWPHGESAMSPQVALDSANWIVDICKEENVKSLRVNFLGGEPFIAIDTVFFFINALQARLPEHVKAYLDGQFLVFTNGDYLSEDVLKECKKHQIYIMLNPTYDNLDIVEKKIEYIKYFCHGCSLAVVLDEMNLPRIVDLTKLIIKHNGHIRINRLYNGGKDPEYVKEYGRQMDKVLDLILTAPKPMWPNWIIESTYPTWQSPKNCYSCGKWLAVIDPDGTLRSCNADLDTKIGSIYTHKHWKELKMHQRWSAKNILECQGCEWITLCQAGCPYTRKLAYGTYDKKTPFCNEFKKLFPKLIKIKDRYVGME
jgi:uncharacterized protein